MGLIYMLQGNLLNKSLIITYRSFFIVESDNNGSKKTPCKHDCRKKYCFDSKSDKDLTLNLMARHPCLVPELFVILEDATNHNFNCNHSSVYNIQEQLSYQKIRKVQVFSSSSPK